MAVKTSVGGNHNVGVASCLAVASTAFGVTTDPQAVAINTTAETVLRKGAGNMKSNPLALPSVASILITPQGI